MTLTRIAILSLLLSATPLSYAIDINISNNTDSFGTARFTFPCSSILGDKGIVNPHQTLNVPENIINMFCSPNCEAHVYFSKDCSGSELATVKINNKTGVTQVTNHQTDKYTITGSGTSVVISPISKGWKSWFNWG